MSQDLRSLVLCSALFCASPLAAGETFGVSLFRPDSLLGWQHAAVEPAGWTMTEGVLRGTAESTPLLSGFVFGDFEFRWQWSVSDGGAWQLALPEAPSGPGLAIALREGDGCGRLTDGDAQLHAGVAIERKPDGRHAATLRRSGGKLELTVDGNRLWEVDLDSQRRFGLRLELAAAEGALANLRAQEPAGEVIFNKTDLTGWWTPGDLSKWRVEDGQIVRTERAGNYLRTEREYGNFTVSFEYQMQKGTNSGLGLRTARDAWPSSDGMELQMFDNPSMGKGGHLSVYGNLPPVAIAHRSEQWNHLAVKAEGYMITAWENGELVQHFNTERHPELRHRNLRGWLGFQDHGNWTRFRNIHVLEAPDGTGLDLWREPPPKQAARVIDRLMNPWLLAEADGITAGAVSRTIAQDEPGEHLLADLTGPGAVVRIAQVEPKGQLAFYFDGEENPRIEAKADGLLNALPQLGEYRNPLITCLTYEKSLRIVLRNARRAECRIDYVTFPADYRTASFTGRGDSLPRGWAESVVYRHLKGRFADYRNPGILPRVESDKLTLAPGASAPAVTLDGAGIVRYVRLRIGSELLENDDLWLEVTVDGESEPAVAAPARLWLASLAGSKNYYNLVHFARNGFGLTQAMPFGEGISFSVRNTGEEPIEDISLEVCLEPAEGERAKQVAAMMRLRGVFQRAGEGGNALADFQGAGRLVALACELPDDAEPGIAELHIDGQPVDGWAAPNLNLLLGQAGEFQASLSGRSRAVAWRYFWLAPIGFQKSLTLRATGAPLGARLALFYAGGQ